MVEILLERWKIVNTREEWLKIIIENRKSKNLSISCPKCGANQFEHLYVCDVQTRLGYMLFWCKSCMTGVHISRVIAPNGEKIIPMDNRDMVEKNTPIIHLVN